MGLFQVWAYHYKSLSHRFWEYTLFLSPHEHSVTGVPVFPYESYTIQLGNHPYLVIMQLKSSKGMIDLLLRYGPLIQNFAIFLTQGGDFF